MLNPRHAILQFIEHSIRSILDNRTIGVPETTLLSDIPGFDSIKTVELILKLEDHFNIRMTAADMDRIGTAGSLADIVLGGAPPVESEITTQSAAAAPAANAGYRIALTRAVMHGPRTRLTGTVEIPPGTQSVTLQHPGLENFAVQLFQDPAKTFDIVCDFDLARHRLDQCRVVVTERNSRLTELAMPQPERLTISAMGDGAANRLHLAASLPEERAKPGITELLQRFESLGDNCEFGVFANMLGDDRPGLFRAGGTSEWMTKPRPGQHTLISALERSFAGLAVNADLRFEYIGDEWLGFSNLYDFCFHTGIKDRNATLTGLAESESRRLQRLTEKFLGDIASPAKIFVRKSNGAEDEAQLTRLACAIRRLGPAWLLWAAPATEEESPGTVTALPNRLLRVTISELSDYKRANRANALAWLTAITAASLVLDSPLGLQWGS